MTPTTLLDAIAKFKIGMVGYPMMVALPIAIYIHMVRDLDVPADCWFEISYRLVGRN